MQNLEKGAEERPKKKEWMDSLAHVPTSGPLLQLTLRVLLNGCHVSLSPVIPCWFLRVGPYVLKLNIS